MTKIPLRGKDLIIAKDLENQEYSWEYDGKGAIGFMTYEQAETDAMFWISFTDSYITDLVGNHELV